MSSLAKNLGPISMEAFASHFVRDKHVAEGESFQWRTKNGSFVNIDQMASHHLFNVLQSIWNTAVVSRNMKTQRNPIRYKFGNFYTPDYMNRAVKAILPELLQRTDLQPFQLERLNFMVEIVLKQAKQKEGDAQ